MNIEELKKRLKELGLDGEFSLRGIAQPEMRPDDVTVIEPEATGKGWTGYYTERGEIFDKQYFQNESDACEYAMKIATRPKPPVRKLSDEERCKGEELNMQRLADFKQRIDIAKTRKLAEQGDATAQNNLGAAYYSGNGVEKDAKEAFNWFRKAAEQGSASAQSILGSFYRDGKVIENDPKESANWYRKAAEQGHASGQLGLGVAYFKGEGVEKNPGEAVKWWRKAAEQEDAVAQRNLGFAYRDGIGVEKDPKESLNWFRKAAEGGDAVAQIYLVEAHRGDLDKNSRKTIH